MLKYRTHWIYIFIEIQIEIYIVVEEFQTCTKWKTINDIKYESNKNVPIKKKLNFKKILLFMFKNIIYVNS